jgi:hypothetical protein
MKNFLLKTISWLLLPLFLVLLAAVLIVESFLRALEFALLYVSLQILKPYPQFNPRNRQRSRSDLDEQQQ